MITNKGCKRLRDLEKKVATGGGSGLLELVTSIDRGNNLLSNQEVTSGDSLDIVGYRTSISVALIVVFDGVEYSFNLDSSLDETAIDMLFVGDENHIEYPFYLHMMQNSVKVYMEFTCADSNTHTIEAYFMDNNTRLNKTAEELMSLYNNGTLPYIITTDLKSGTLIFMSLAAVEYNLPNYSEGKGRCQFYSQNNTDIVLEFNSLSDYPHEPFEEYDPYDGIGK